MKVVNYVLIAIPLLIPGYCVYRMGSQIHSLRTLCAQAQIGSPIKTFLDSAAKTGLDVRAAGPLGTNQNSPFEREYQRMGEYLRKVKKSSDDYTVVYAKPGIGLAQCLVLHRDGSITDARYWNDN